jgi:hypothetical protein
VLIFLVCLSHVLSINIVWCENIGTPQHETLAVDAIQVLGTEWITISKRGLANANPIATNMLMSAIQSILVELLTIQEESTYKHKLKMLWYLTRSTLRFFQRFPDAVGPIEAPCMLYTHFVLLLLSLILILLLSTDSFDVDSLVWACFLSIIEQQRMPMLQIQLSVQFPWKCW